MKLSAIFPVLLLVGVTYTAPVSDDKVTIDKEFFPDSLAVYTAEHDIINILVPLNALNFEEDDDEDSDEAKSTIFFVEADIKENGQKDYKGLFVRNNEEVKKLLENGRDAAATNDDSKTAYFGASDGIYTYNQKENTAEKYGTVTESIISIAKENATDVIYILTDNHELYKVTENGNKKTKVDEIANAQQIVLDYSNNLYFYGPDKQPYVYNADGVKEITGIPKNPSYTQLLKPPFVIEDGVPFIADNKAYVLYANGSSEVQDFELEVKPTAYAMEATLIQYFAYNKKIYEYNIIALIFSELLEELKNFLDDKKDVIQSIATRSRSEIRA